MTDTYSKGHAEKRRTSGKPSGKAKSMRDRISAKMPAERADDKPSRPDASARLEKLNRAVLIGTFTTVAALIFGVASIASSQATVAHVTSNMTDVVVASKDISAGTTITGDMVTKSSVPASYVASSTFAAIEDVVGKTTNAPITQNGQVTSKVLAGASDASSLAAKVSPGHQALTISVKSDTGLYNLLRCGDEVDVYAADPSTAGSVKIAEGIPVLALDASLTGPDGSSTYSTATLEVTQDQTENILAAEELGGVHLALNPLSERKGA